MAIEGDEGGIVGIGAGGPGPGTYWYPVPGHPNGGVWTDSVGNVYQRDPSDGSYYSVDGASVWDVEDIWNPLPDEQPGPRGPGGPGGPGGSSRNYAWETGEREAAQAWEAEQDLARRIWENEQRIGGQDWRSGESGLDRDQRAGEFGANYELERAANQRANLGLGLQGASQMANLIGSVDPAAIPAFLAAGGGNISNAIARGGSAVSNNAMLGAARTLRTMDQPLINPDPYQYVRGTNPYVSQPGATAEQQQQLGMQRAVMPDQQRPTYQKVPGYAQGGMTTAPAFLGNEQGAEMFVNPTQAPIGVIPNRQTKQMLGMMGKRSMMGQGGQGGTGMMPGMMPGYAQGTGLVQPEDTSYLNTIRGIRQGVQIPNVMPGNEFNAGWGLQSPTMRARYYQARQTKFGTPVEDQMMEAERYRLGGLGRNQRQIGY